MQQYTLEMSKLKYHCIHQAYSEWNLHNLFQYLAINIMPYCICAVYAYANLDFHYAGFVGQVMEIRGNAQFSNT